MVRGSSATSQVRIVVTSGTELLTRIYASFLLYRIRIKPDEKFVLGEEKSDECVSDDD